MNPSLLQGSCNLSLWGPGCWRWVADKVRFLTRRFAGRPAPTGECCLVFVGARLLAMGGVQGVFPHSKIRWQASSYRGMLSCICRGQAAGEGWRTPSITAGEQSLAGQLLQGNAILYLIGVEKDHRPSPPSEPCVQFSRTRLSSQWFPHRDWLARLAVSMVNSPRSAK